MQPTTAIQPNLQQHYPLTDEQIGFYRENGFIKLKQVLDEEALNYFGDAITKRVELLNKETRPMGERTTYGKAFLQLFNLWREDEVIKQFVFSKRLARIAAELMEVGGVRIYHDQALYKEPGGGITPWHADQYYWPLQTDKTVTAWIPLQPTPLDMGPLEFSAGSQRIVSGRELEIGDESEKLIKEKLTVTDFKHVVEPFDLGEVSFHSGWVFHRAGANNSSDMRKVMTIIYMDAAMKLKQPDNKNQINDWHTWCPGAVVGETIDTPLNPVIYQK